VADLRRFIDPIKSQLDDTLVDEPRRPYLGFSTLGEECRRKLWYGWRWATKKKIPRRKIRLLERGRAEEEIIVRDLESVGMKVIDRQDEMVHTLMGRHVMGHSDGTVLGVPFAEETPHLGEFKTMADRYWQTCARDGVEKADWKYYCQMQIYMMYKKLTRALFVATNKNNDKRIYEKVNYDEAVAKEIHIKATDIVTSEGPPRRIVDDPAFHVCKMCDHRRVCYGMAKPEINCRTCVHADVCDDGVWECSYWEKEIPEEAQRLGCQHHQPMAML